MVLTSDGVDHWRRWLRSREHPAGHWEAWDAILDARLPRPPGYQPPYRRPEVADRAKRLVVAALVASASKTLPVPSELRVWAPGTAIRLALGAHAGGATEIARALFSHRHRGALIVFGDGARVELRLLLRHYARQWTADGYHVKPMGTGAQLRAIAVSKGGQTWTLCDAAAMTGSDGLALIREHYHGTRKRFTLAHELPALYAQLDELQGVLLARVGVSYRPTIGRMAMRAASRFLPEKLWKWHCDPTLEAMMRSGWGMRGGYVFARPWRGPAWRYDVHRLYTSCLARELPMRLAGGHCLKDGVERAGFFLCTVRGPGRFPVYLGVWHPERREFVKGYWNGSECIAVLPQAEFAGLRALGYTVTPGYGYIATHTANLKGYVSALEMLTWEYGKETPVGRACKLLGNCVWGKWAENPTRDDIRYGETRPAPEWRPMCDAQGDEVPKVWTRRRRQLRVHMHVDLAAYVTAIARSTLYGAIATAIDAGAHVLASDTDGLVLDQDCADELHVGEQRFGTWRSDGYDPDAIIAGRKAYVFGEDVRLAGGTGPTRGTIATMQAGGQVSLPGRVSLPPWEGGPLWQPEARRFGVRNPVPDTPRTA